jgi:hypothetical protein
MYEPPRCLLFVVIGMSSVDHVLIRLIVLFTLYFYSLSDRSSGLYDVDLYLDQFGSCRIFGYPTIELSMIRIPVSLLGL